MNIEIFNEIFEGYVPSKKKNGELKKAAKAKMDRIEAAKKEVEKYIQDQNYEFFKLASSYGSVSRQQAFVTSEYNGRYGTGITIDIPSFGASNMYHTRLYFIRK